MIPPRELLKLACSGRIYVLKIVRNKDGMYALRRMRALTYPSWETIASAKTEQELQFDIGLHRNRMSVLLVSENPKASDYDNMKKAGFRVFRKSEGRTPAIEEYTEESRRWKKFKKFPSVNMRDCFFSELLYEKLNVSIN